MPAADWDDSYDEVQPWEYPDEDTPDDELTDTISCPECGADVYEDADQCPVCGHYIVPDTRVWTGRSIWWIALALLGIGAVILALGLGI